MDGQLIQKKDCSAAMQAAMPEAKSLAEVWCAVVWNDSIEVRQAVILG